MFETTNQIGIPIWIMIWENMENIGKWMNMV